MGNPTTVDHLEKINRLLPSVAALSHWFPFTTEKKKESKDCLFLLFSLDLFLSLLACVGGLLKFLSCFILQFFMVHILMCCSSSAGCKARAHEGGQCSVSAYNSNG